MSQKEETFSQYCTRSFFPQNLLGGALLGCWPLGFPLCCVLTAVGASNCFLLSRLVGKAIIQRKFATKIQWFQEKVRYLFFSVCCYTVQYISYLRTTISVLFSYLNYDTCTVFVCDHCSVWCI